MNAWWKMRVEHYLIIVILIFFALSIVRDWIWVLGVLIKNSYLIFKFIYMEKEKLTACQFCLANSNYTKISKDKNRRCPVCGSDYTGERRDREFRILVESGLYNWK